MTTINKSIGISNMPQNCGMKGMHETHSNHLKKTEIVNTQQTAKVKESKNDVVGNKLDVRV